MKSVTGRLINALPVSLMAPCSIGVHVAQDLPRTFPSNAWVGSAEGQGALRNVLLAFSVHKPDVGYCQSMNFVAAMLLLCLNLSEERAFWVMVALIDDNGQCCPSIHLHESSQLILSSVLLSPVLLVFKPCHLLPHYDLTRPSASAKYLSLVSSVICLFVYASIPSTGQGQSVLGYIRTTKSTVFWRLA